MLMSKFGQFTVDLGDGLQAEMFDSEENNYILEGEPVVEERDGRVHITVGSLTRVFTLEELKK